MQYQELLTHLYHIKLLSHLDRYNITPKEHFKSIIETQKLRTEANWNLGDKELKATLAYIENAYIDANRANEKDKRGIQKVDMDAYNFNKN